LKKKQNSINVKNITFNPPFIENIFLIHLDKKQNTQTSITNYLRTKSEKNDLIKRINLISEEMLQCKNLNHFEDLIVEHESIISQAISQEPIQKLTFNDYNLGKIKSLGAWGGDFILVTSKNNDLSYFNNKGFETILKLSDLVYIV